MYKIAVIGAYDSIYGFAALGLDTFPVKSQEEGIHTLRRLAGGEYAVIYKEQQLPAIIQIPGVSGNTGEGVNGVKRSVEQAVGSDILFGSN